MEQESSQSLFGEPTGDTSGIDVDALMTEVESGASERQMSAPEPTAAPTQEPAAAPTPSEIEFAWNGKQVKAAYTDPRVKQWASQGYDYNQRMEQFKQEREVFEKQQSGLKEIESRYKPVEDYIEKNPQWWDHVQKAYQQAMGAAQSQSPNDPTAVVEQKVLKSLEAELGPVKQFIQEQQIKQQTEARQAEDHALETEIKSIREQYRDLDWNSSDESGRPLELRVLEHAAAQNISSFRAAFRDYQHDQLVKLAEERGKQTVVKERQAKTRMGLLGQSPTPKKGVTAAENVKSKSYDELMAEGAEEYGATY